MPCQLTWWWSNDTRGLRACTILATRPPLVRGYIAQWLEPLTADQQVPGSNPGVPFLSFPSQRGGRHWTKLLEIAIPWWIAKPGRLAHAEDQLNLG